MTDRVYPSAKPATNGAAAPNPAFPATKAQLYSNTRPAYRPQPHRHRRSRSRCCSCCLWIIFLLILQIFIAAIFGAVFYLIYKPQRPNFSVTSLKLSTLNLTSSSQLNSRFDINVTARNPNKKLVFLYNSIAISILSNDDIDVGDGSIPAFTHGKKNTTLLKARIASSGKHLESTDVTTLKAEMKSKAGLGLKVRLDTRVRVKVFGVKTPKIGIRVHCEGIKVTSLPSAKAAATASTKNAKCKVDVRVKIWKWTV
ncbi:NDR1/HIN1-like protein 13 [Argentina anserina]|uniref:NDR1/HIN1-like protein 13 n=1 Tax=Argentina anserina TaxID=57926 RepID=UPI00217620B0|nr:NDR1/HIN1-like protein 13 [Potentilla anserina]